MSFDIVALAERIHRQLSAYEDRHGVRPKITPALSRILENDPTYVPYRERAATKHRKPSVNPSISTVAEIAATLECTVAGLLGEIAITEDDARTMCRLSEILREAFHLSVVSAGRLRAAARATRPNLDG